MTPRDKTLACLRQDISSGDLVEELQLLTGAEVQVQCRDDEFGGFAVDSDAHETVGLRILIEDSERRC